MISEITKDNVLEAVKMLFADLEVAIYKDRERTEDHEVLVWHSCSNCARYSGGLKGSTISPACSGRGGGTKSDHLFGSDGCLEAFVARRCEQGRWVELLVHRLR